MAAAPIIALVLFFVTDFANNWLVFLLIPLTAVVVYGKDWHDD